MQALATARPIALACLALAIGLSLILDAPLARAVGVGIAFVAAFGIYELAARSRAAREGDDAWGGRDRRRNPLLRTLTDQMLVHVRELNRHAESIREGERSRDKGESELNRLEEDMVELVRKMRRSAALQYEPRAKT